jgi:hypothetical protein
MHLTIAVSTSTWYGLPASQDIAGLLIYGPLYHHFHGHRFQEDLPRARDFPSSKLNYDFIARVELINAGRVATACLSVASVILGETIAADLPETVPAWWRCF